MGRPKGSKNKPKVQVSEASASAGGPTITPRQLPDKVNLKERGVVFPFTVHYGHAELGEDVLSNPVGEMLIKMQKIHEKLSDNVYIRSAAMQLERCPDTGRIHIQGYVQLKDTQRLSYATKLFAASWRVGYGSAQENWTYCTDDETHVEGTPRLTIGTPVGQGARTDVTNVLRDVLDGRMDANDVMQANPDLWMRNYRAIDTMVARRITPRTEAMHVIWLWGPSGSGKTQWIRENVGDDFTDRRKWYFKDNSKWWNNYMGQEYVVWDDFDLNPSDNVFFRWLLRFMDLQALPIQGETKGGYTELNSKYLIITCEFHPSHWFEGNTLTQITRRVTQFINPAEERLKIMDAERKAKK